MYKGNLGLWPEQNRECISTTYFSEKKKSGFWKEHCKLSVLRPADFPGPGEFIDLLSKELSMTETVAFIFVLIFSFTRVGT